MALVGSGTLKIQNHVAEGNFRAGSIDTSLAAIVKELGGTYWQDGVPVSTPGNLDGSNIVVKAMPNAAKAQPSAYTTLSLRWLGWRPSGNYQEPRAAFSVVVPQDLVAIEAVLAVNCTTLTTITGTANVYVNGNKVAQLAGPGDVTGLAVTRGVFSQTTLRRGDVVAVDLSGFAVTGTSPYVYNPTVTLWCKAQHI